ncbi:host-nuclease inhibitor Gam family protein [bacterium]|nr:host-nuclease inhibitor Gam family protein [bacterium]
MTKTKGIQTSIKDMDEADDVLREISELQHRQQEVENWVTEEEQAIREKAKGKLLLNKNGETVADRIAKLSADLLGFVEQNADMFKGEPRRRELAHGTIGIRLGMHQVATVGKITLKAIMNAEAMVKRLRAWGWIKETPSLDKAKILETYKSSDRVASSVLTRLRQVSLTVKQDDEPWFETREADLEAGRAAA